MNILDWLRLHHNKQYLPVRWAELTGIRIIDADGWRRADIEQPCDLEEFLRRIDSCTVQPTSWEDSERAAGVH